MNRWQNPLKLNALLLVVALLLALVSGSVSGGDLFFVLGTVMLLLVPVNLVVGMVRNRDKKPDGTAYLLLAGLLLVLGFCTCSAGFAFGDINFH